MRVPLLPTPKSRREGVKKKDEWVRPPSNAEFSRSDIGRVTYQVVTFKNRFLSIFPISRNPTGLSSRRGAIRRSWIGSSRWNSPAKIPKGMFDGEMDVLVHFYRKRNFPILMTNLFWNCFFSESSKKMPSLLTRENGRSCRITAIRKIPRKGAWITS